MDTYTFSEAITLASKFLRGAFNGKYEVERNFFATYASKWFTRAEEARENGTVRGETFFRKNWL